MNDKEIKRIQVSHKQMEKQTEMLLMKTYPNYAWYVEVNPHLGQLWIRNYMTPDNRGMIINLYKGVSSSELEKKIIMFGGELLERYDLPRAASSLDAEIFYANMEQKLIDGISRIYGDETNIIK